ncbi:hypothetical protein C3F09_12720 [candidate division GN15 bacterium]|uniref:DUF4412 domain-containing protein n=1 Tax=candidate division GN15 bacterium TaxID=2072418 RepID=A0A855X322_9BACT|nr:MAG: hypothetical protein C3F09_12720 [candidate division GN15 bacterium]
MKRWMMWGIIVLVVASAAFAARKKEAAGIVKDKVYQDAEYGFQFKVNDNWSAKVGKADLNSRVILIQKNWAVPPQYAAAKDYTYIPHAFVFADTTGLSAAAIIDSLLSPTYKSKLKKEITKEWEFLDLPNRVVKNRRTMTIAGQTAVMWQAECRYVKDIAASASSNAGVQVSGAYSGMILAIKNGDTLFLVLLMCESNFLNEVMTEVKGMLMEDTSLQWVKAGN